MRMGIGDLNSEVEKENLNDTYINAIQWEYAQIDESWLQLHYKITVGLFVFSFFVEFAMGMLLINSTMVTTTVYIYFLKFFIIPSGINFICIAIDSLIMKSDRISQIRKIYSISLIFVCIDFILFTVHITFAATYFIFAIAIMLTTVYANYWLTSITAAASILAVAVSELFIKWDTDKITVFQSTQRLGDFLISLFVLIAFSIACMVIIRFEQRKNRASIQKEIERQQLQESILMDEMTGIYNRKAFSAELKSIEDHAQSIRYILAVMDIDNFKSINDTWGHHMGDRCLIELAGILKECNTKVTSFRYGGDEFCLLFSDVDMVYAEEVCKEIQDKVNHLNFEGYPTLKLTVSFGLAENSDQMDTMRLFIHADHALYEAKRVRNAIRIF